ncbi:hypothetical protein DSECCO2_628660 [anaerobic digester metagenome]
MPTTAPFPIVTTTMRPTATTISASVASVSSDQEPALYAWQVIKRGNPDFYPAPGNGTKSLPGLHGLVALPNSREADFFIAADWSYSMSNNSA